MKRYIIKEIPACDSDFTEFFDGDSFSEKCGDYCATLFLVSFDHGRMYGLNIEEYKRIIEKIDSILEYFEDEEAENMDIYIINYILIMKTLLSIYSVISSLKSFI